MSSMPAAAPQTAPALSETQRIVNTFIAPSRTFSDLRRNSRWWAPWIVLAISFVAFVAVMIRK